MSSKISSSSQNSIDFHKVYKTAVKYIVAGYNKSITWITANSKWAFSKLADISVIAKRSLIYSFEIGKTFVLAHKVWIIGGIVIGIALLIIYKFWKNQPQYPIIKMESPPHLTTLSIAIPKEKRVPPNVSLTFCIDVSGSMKEEGREQAVKRGVSRVLDSAQKVINASKGAAAISIAIIAFNSDSKVITPATKLVPQNNGSQKNLPIAKIKKDLKAMNSDGGTKILDGLEKATEELEKVAKVNRAASQTLILLTDGGDELVLKRISSLHKRLASSQVKLFAIGIGAGHDKEVLRGIAGDNTVIDTKSGFKGTYIDTTLGEDTIESAISDIYNQALASFNKLQLTSPQLEPGTWSVLNTPMTVENGVSICRLGSLQEEEELFKVIEIHGERLTRPVNVSEVTFDLTFEDPRGRKGQVSLPWNQKTTITPEIAKAVKTEMSKRVSRA